MATRKRKKAAPVEVSGEAETEVEVSGESPKTVDAKAAQAALNEIFAESAHEALNDFLGTNKEAARENVLRRRKKRPGQKESSDPWGKVIETVFDIDPPEVLDRLTEELELGLFVGEYGRLRDAVDRAAKNLYDAKRLERGAKLAEQAFIDDQAVEMDVLRNEARHQLQAKRVKGSGAITKQQVEDEMTATWPDTVARHRKRKRELHAAARALEGLVDAWNHRNSQLKAMLERSSLGRPRGGGQ